MELQPGFPDCKHTIELDCAPGAPRPDTLLPGVIDGILSIEDFHNTSRSFGNWVFQLNPIKNEIYNANKETIASRVKSLYPGSIRYGSW